MQEGLKGDILSRKYSVHFLSDIIKDFVDAVIFTDSTGKILEWNAGVSDIFSYKAGQVLGRNIDILFDSKGEKDRLFGEVQDRGYVKCLTMQMRDKHGRCVKGIVSSRKLDAQGDKDGLVMHVIKDATALLDELEEVKRLNAYLENFIEDAPVGIILVDGNGKIIRFNRKQEENSKISRDVALGRPIEEVFKDTYRYEEVRVAHNKLASGEGKRVSLLLDHYLPQFYEEDMTFRMLGSTFGEGMGYAIFCEIEKELYNAKRDAERTGNELRLSQKYLSALLDASPNIVISVDERRRVISFNRKAEELLGVRAEQTYNTLVDRFFTEDDRGLLREAISSSGLWYGTLNVLRSNGTSFLVELYSTKIEDDRTGTDIATLLIAKDVEETEQLRQSLIQSQKMSFLGEIMGSLAHQINNPLVGVVNISDIVLKKVDPKSDIYRYIKMIWEAGHTCNNVVSRLLRFSRKGNKNVFRDLDVIDLLNSTIDIINMQSPFKDIIIKKDFKKVYPVKGDMVLLEQAIINILWNAAQSMDGKGQIDIGCYTVEGDRPEVVISIRDRGRGIREEDKDKIFEPFFTTKAEDNGTGLGLALSCWIIKDHNGRIEVDSAAGQGSLFKVFLPQAGA